VNDILDYFNACYGDTTGVLHIAVGHSPYMCNDSYTFTTFVPSHFTYPDEADRAEREILREATLHDVYVCPYLMWADKRAKGAAVAHILIHADVDEGLLDAEKVCAIGGFAVASGTPGNGHAYVPLSESVIAPVHRALCRGRRLSGCHRQQDHRQRSTPATRNLQLQTHPRRPRPRPSGVGGAPMTAMRVNPHTLAERLVWTSPKPPHQLQDQLQAAQPQRLSRSTSRTIRR
jgi:hypothetical protein